MSKNQNVEWLSARDASEFLGVCHRTFYKAKKAGLLPEPEYHGRYPYYRRSELAGLEIKGKRGRKAGQDAR